MRLKNIVGTKQTQLIDWQVSERDTGFVRTGNSKTMQNYRSTHEFKLSERLTIMGPPIVQAISGLWSAIGYRLRIEYRLMKLALM